MRHDCRRVRIQTTDYTQGDAFQTEKRTDFLPGLAAALRRGPDRQAGRLPVARRWAAGASSRCATRRARCACCATPAGTRTCRWSARPPGNCESFRCRFHGWTYDLQGKFLSAPPPVAPADPTPGANDLQSLAGARAQRPGVLRDRARRRPASSRPISASPTAARSSPTSPATGRSAVEHLLGEQGVSEPEFAWFWPLLVVRRVRAGRARRAGRAAHLPAHPAVHATCSAARSRRRSSRRPARSRKRASACRLERAAGTPADGSALLAAVPPAAGRGLYRQFVTAADVADDLAADAAWPAISARR